MGMLVRIENKITNTKGTANAKLMAVVKEIDETRKILTKLGKSIQAYPNNENINITNRVKVTEKNKLILLAGDICNMLMMHQIIKLEYLHSFTKKRYPTITKKEFDYVLTLLKSSMAITGITDKYVYQTSSTLFKGKTIKEITSLI